MSGRDDSILYTGMNSKSFVAEQVKKEDKRDQKETKRIQLQPYQELISTEISKLRDELSAELGNLIHIDTTEADVKSVVLGIRLADSKLVSLQIRLGNIVRQQARTAKKELDDETEL